MDSDGEYPSENRMKRARASVIVGVLLSILGLVSCSDEPTSFYRNQILYSEVITILPGRIRAFDWELDKGDELRIDVISSLPLTNVALIQGDAAWANYLQRQVYEPYQSLLEKDAQTVSWKAPLDKREFYYLLLENDGKDTVTVTVRVRY